MRYQRIFTIVLDSLGIGAMEDSPEYGDVGVDTLGHIAACRGHLQIPNLKRLGIANLKALHGVEPVESPLAAYMRLREKSCGKDTMTGHWEMMGLYVTKPFQTFTETGFPKELIEELEKRTGRTIIGNKFWRNWGKKKSGMENLLSIPLRIRCFRFAAMRKPWDWKICIATVKLPESLP